MIHMRIHAAAVVVIAESVPSNVPRDVYSSAAQQIEYERQPLPLVGVREADHGLQVSESMRHQQLTAHTFPISASSDYKHSFIPVFSVMFEYNGIDAMQQCAVNVIITGAVIGAAVCGQNIDVVYQDQSTTSSTAVLDEGKDRALDFSPVLQ